MPIINLFNFCDFPEYQITLPDSGIILLDGPSGVGKSTLFQAMAFVLHDHMKSNCYPRGDDSKSKPKTWVMVSWPAIQLTIFRQRRPNLLIVQHQGVEYKDDAAQGWINAKYGSAHRWQAASYRQQDERWSFLDLNSAEKLQVLQEIAGDAWSPAYSRLYDHTTQLIHKAEQAYRENTLQKAVHQKTYEYTRSQVPAEAQSWTAEDQAYRKKKYSSDFLSIDTYEKDVQAWYAQEIRKCRTTMEGHRNQISQRQSQIAHNQRLQSNIKQYQKLLAGLPSIDQPISQLEERLSHARAAKLVSQQLERRSQILLFLSSVETQLSKITVSQPPPYPERQLEQWKALLQKYTQPDDRWQGIQEEFQRRQEVQVLEKHTQLTSTCTHLQKDIQQKTQKIKELQATIDQLPTESKVQRIGEVHQELGKAKLQQSALTCPHCENRLYLNSGRLQSLPPVEGSLDDLQKELQGLQLNEQRYNQRPSLSTQLLDLQQSMEKQKTQLTTVEDQLKDIHLPERPISPGRYASYTVNQLQSEQDILQSVKDIPINMDQINVYLSEYEQLKQKALLVRQQEQATQDLHQLPTTEEPPPTDIPTNIDQLTAEIQKAKHIQAQRAEYENKITALEAQIVIIPLDDVDHEQSIRDIESQLQHLTQDEQKERQAIGDQRILIQLQDIYTRYMTLLEEEAQLTQRITRLNKIKSVLSLAEYSILDSVLNRINRKINKYLSQMFVEPISVQLRAIREEKTTERLKAEINLQITFGDAQFKSLTSLSGGQRSRVYLAFCLAFARLSYTPYILLDECTASLDIQAKELVLQTMTESFIDHPKSEKRRLIYITHHDTTEGVYTSVVKL